MKPYIFLFRFILLMLCIPMVLNAQSNQTVITGANTAAANFPASTCVYSWTNSNPAIGLPASGIGDIPSFTAINNGNAPITATIIATPVVTGNLYVTTLGTNTTSVINTATNTVVGTLAAGGYGVAISPDGSQAYVSTSSTNSVKFFNTTNYALTQTVLGFSQPFVVATTPDGNNIYVGNYGSSNVWKLSTTNPSSITSINVGQTPLGMAVSTDGSKVYVVNQTDGTISVINVFTNAILNTITIGSRPSYAAISPDGSRLYVSHSTSNTVSIINTITNTLQTVVNVAVSPNGIIVSPDGSRVYVTAFANVVSVINTTTNTVTNTIPVGRIPFALSLSPDGGLLYVANQGSNDISVINTSNFSLTATIPLGAVPYAISSVADIGGVCTALPVTFTVTVNPTSPVITATGVPSSVATTYGTASSSSNFMVSGANTTTGILVTPPAGFEVSKDNVNFTNTVTIGAAGTIVSTRVYIRLKKTTAAGTYSGNIVLSSPGAADVNVAMPASTVNPQSVNVYVYGSIPYGSVINDFQAVASNFDFSIINAGLKNGETVNSIDIAFTGGNTGHDPAGIYNTIHTSNITGANGFILSNYNINYATGPLTVAPADLIITANNVTKVVGTAITGGVGSTAFTTNGLQNGETINTVTIAYGSGAAANAPAGTYTGSVVASAAIGGNGFLASNYNIIYTPGNITVAAPAPSITASGTLVSLTTVYGTPSSSTSFNASGVNLTAGILITPPVGFEVSADNITFNNTVTIGSAGTVASTPVYIRLKQTTFVGNYSGNIVLRSSGAADVNKAMPASTVTPAPLSITANNVSKIYGNTLTSGPGSTAFSITGLQNAETANTVTLAYTTGANAAANTGTYTGSVTPSAATAGTFTPGNYTITYQPGNITVTPAPLTITADNQTKIYGDANPTLTITYRGFVAGDGATQLTMQPTIATTAVQTSAVGQYPITVSGAASSNYTLSYVNGTLTVVPPGITVPNAFSPNGDGINDTWNITNINTYSNITVEIMNRYGTRVYFSNGYSAPWDGRYNGAQAPFGVYYYIITGVNKKPMAGYITLLR